MNKFFKVFIEEEALEDIILFDDEYPNLNKIFGSGDCIFHVNISKEILDRKLNDPESDLSHFLNSHDIPQGLIKSDQDVIEKVHNDKVIKVNDGRVLYIVDNPKEETDAMQKNYGVIVQNSENIDDNVFDIRYAKRLTKNKTLKEDKNGWKSIFSRIDFPPMNSIVITDNYLFTGIENKKNIGESNIKDFFEAILPEQLVEPFHITIISGNKNIPSVEIAKRISAYVSSCRNYPIYTEVAYCKTMHEREIISNYFIIVCDKGFQLFKANEGQKNVITDSNILRIESIFNDLEFRGDTNLTMSYFDLKDLHDILKKLRKQKDLNDPSRQLITTFPEKIKENRLFSDL